MKKIVFLLAVVLGLVKFAEPKGVVDIGTLRKGLFRKDSKGKVYLAVSRHFFHKGQDLQGAVTAQNMKTVEQLERQNIALAADGKPAIKMAVIINDENDILTFAQGLNKGVINTGNHTVTIDVANDTLAAVVAEILLSQGAQVSPLSGSSNDFSSGAVNFTVKAEDGTQQVWAVTAREKTDILTFVLAEQTGAATINPANHTIAIEVANGTDVTDLSPTITLPNGSSIAPLSEVSQNFTNPVTYTVTDEDGETQDWTVTVTEAAE